MWRGKPARLSAWLLYVYTASMLMKRTRLFFPRGGVSNLKGLKRFPRRVAHRIVGPRTPIDRRLLRSRPPTHIPFRLFSLPVSTVTYCELLRAAMPPCPKKTVPFGAKNFRQRERWCGRPARLLAIRFVVTCVAGIASFVVCDNNFYDAHWLSGDRWRYCGPRRGETPPRRARIREGLS